MAGRPPSGDRLSRDRLSRDRLIRERLSRVRRDLALYQRRQHSQNYQESEPDDPPPPELQYGGQPPEYDLPPDVHQQYNNDVETDNPYDDVPPTTELQYGGQLPESEYDLPPDFHQQYNNDFEPDNPYDVPPPELGYEIPPQEQYVYDDDLQSESKEDDLQSESKEDDLQSESEDDQSIEFQHDYHQRESISSISPSEVQFYTPVESKIITSESSRKIASKPKPPRAHTYGEDNPQELSSKPYLDFQPKLRRAGSKKVPFETETPPISQPHSRHDDTDAPSRPMSRTGSKKKFPFETTDAPSRPLSRAGSKKKFPFETTNAPSRPISRAGSIEEFPFETTDALSRPLSRAGSKKKFPFQTTNAPSRPISRAGSKEKFPFETIIAPILPPQDRYDDTDAPSRTLSRAGSKKKFPFQTTNAPSRPLSRAGSKKKFPFQTNIAPILPPQDRYDDTDAPSRTLSRAGSKKKFPFQTTNAPSRPLSRAGSKEKFPFQTNIAPILPPQDRYDDTDAPSRPTRRTRSKKVPFKTEFPPKPQPHSRYDNTDAPSQPLRRTFSDLNISFTTPFVPPPETHYYCDDDIPQKRLSEMPPLKRLHRLSSDVSSVSSHQPFTKLIQLPRARPKINDDKMLADLDLWSKFPQPLSTSTPPSQSDSDSESETHPDTKQIEPISQAPKSTTRLDATYMELDDEHIQAISALTSSSDTKSVPESRTLPQPPSSASVNPPALPLFQQAHVTSSSSTHTPPAPTLPPPFRAGLLSNPSHEAKPGSRSDIGEPISSANAPSPVSPPLPLRQEVYPERATRKCDCTNPQVTRLLEAYVRFSLAHRIYLIMSGQYHSEEVQLIHQHYYWRQIYAKKLERLQFLSMCLFGIGVIFVVFYFALSAAMLVLGGFGYYHCSAPSSNLVVYLLFGGTINLAMILLRCFTSMLTELKSRNSLGAHDSTLLTGIILTMEFMLLPLLIMSLVIIVTSSVTLINNWRNIICSDTIIEKCCPLYVLVVTAILTALQFTLYLLTVPYVSSVLILTYQAGTLKEKTKDLIL